MTASQKTPDQLQGLDELVILCMQEAKEPGLALTIVKDGEVLLSQGYGKRNLAEDLEVTPQTLFAIASCSKAFTAMALAMLVDDGLLDWDIPIRHYIPSFKLSDPFASERLTARDLLIHNSGLPDNTLAWYNAPISRKELVERLQYFEPTHDFRSTWQYNNMMYATAGYLVEVLSGLSWEDFTRQRIFQPLGMTNANFSILDSQLTSDYSLPYTDREFKGNVRPIEFYSREQAIGPAGAINANMVDMAKWVICLLNKGKYGSEDQHLLSETEFTHLMTSQIVEPNEIFGRYKELALQSYALGWSVLSYRGHLMVQHGGLTDGFCSLVTLLPDEKIGIVICTNLETSVIHHSITYTLCDRLLGLPELPWRERLLELKAEIIKQIRKGKQETETGRCPDAPPSHPLSAYTGTFLHSGFGSFSVELDGDRLTGSLNDLPYSFDHFHYDVFLLHTERFDLSCKGAFQSNLQGDIESLSLSLEPETKPIVFVRPPKQDTKERGI